MPNKEPTIRARRDSDIERLASVLVAVHKQDGYPVEGVDDPNSWLELSSPLGAWVAELDGTVVGHVALTEPMETDGAARLWVEQNHATNDEVAVLGRLFVDPVARGSKLGLRLVRTATAEATRLGRQAVLDVMLKDAAAIRVYESMGWRSIGELTHVHSGGKLEPARAYAAPQNLTGEPNPIPAWAPRHRIALEPTDRAASKLLSRQFKQIRRLHRSLTRDSRLLLAPGSELELLRSSLPDPTVDLYYTVGTGLSSAVGAIGLVHKQILGDYLHCNGGAALSLTRMATLASSRLLFGLGPLTREERVINSSRLLRQEAESLNKCYRKTWDFKYLNHLVPPPAVKQEQDRRLDAILKEAPPLKETQMLELVPKIILPLVHREQERGALLHSPDGLSGLNADELVEHLIWIFNVHSGAAHGYGWPNLMPQTDGLPGDFLGDLGAAQWLTLLALRRVAELATTSSRTIVA